MKKIWYAIIIALTTFFSVAAISESYDRKVFVTVCNNPKEFIILYNDSTFAYLNFRRCFSWGTWNQTESDTITLFEKSPEFLDLREEVTHVLSGCGKNDTIKCVISNDEDTLRRLPSGKIFISITDNGEYREYDDRLKEYQFIRAFKDAIIAGDTTLFKTMACDLPKWGICLNDSATTQYLHNYISNHAPADRMINFYAILLLLK